MKRRLFLRSSPGAPVTAAPHFNAVRARLESKHGDALAASHRKH
jgi:hypothetical protein